MPPRDRTGLAIPGLCVSPWAFLKWVLWEGRSPKKRADFEAVAQQYPDKFQRFTSPRQLKKELKL